MIDSADPVQSWSPTPAAWGLRAREDGRRDWGAAGDAGLRYTRHGADVHHLLGRAALAPAEGVARRALGEPVDPDSTSVRAVPPSAGASMNRPASCTRGRRRARVTRQRLRGEGEQAFGVIACTVARQARCSYPGQAIGPCDTSPRRNGPSSLTWNDLAKFRDGRSGPATRVTGCVQFDAALMRSAQSADLLVAVEPGHQRGTGATRRLRLWVLSAVRWGATMAGERGTSSPRLAVPR